MTKKPTKTGKATEAPTKHTDDCTFHSDVTRCTCGLLAAGDGRGRPTKLNLTVQGIIVEAISKGTTKKDAAEAAGIRYQTFNEWMKAGEAKDAEPLFADFSDAIKRAEAECANQMAAIVQKAAKKQWQAAAWWLERRRRDDYALRREITGADGEPFITDHFVEAQKRAGKFSNPKKSAKK